VGETKQEKVPHVNESGGILAVCVMGADGEEYLWQGSGSAHVTRTFTKQEYYEGGELKTRRVDVKYITVVLALDESQPQATLPVQAAPAAEPTADPWEH
jgi:hypothetical protein